MKTNRLIRFSNGCVRIPYPVGGRGIQFVLCIGTVLFLGASNVFAPPGGGGRGGGGFAPGVNMGSPSAGAGSHGAGAGGQAGVGGGAAGQAGVGGGAAGAGVFPNGTYYYYTVPAGYTKVYYGGYQCAYVNGVYYRPVYYQGIIIYVVVT